MDYLQQLLNNQPVEWKKLGEVCDIKTGKGVTKKDAVEDGVYPIISGGKTPMDYIDKYNRDANTVTVSRVGANAGYVNYLGEKFYLNDKCFSVIPKIDYIDSKFLYYILKAREQQITAMQSLGGVPTINTSKVGSIEIPIPPLSVQSRIVEILDKFTAMEAELEEQLQAELELRKKQYAYYREQLLNFSYTPPSEFNVVYRKLGEVCRIKNGRDYKHLGEGKVPVYGSGGIMKYVDEYVYDKPTVLIPRKGSLSNLFYVDTPFWNVDTIFYTEIDSNQICPKFLFHFLATQKLEKLNMAGGVPSLTQTTLNKLPIPIPPLSEQARIVEILDKFDTLTNSISEGLPLEIKLRRQQYEYYREQLLDFRR